MTGYKVLLIEDDPDLPGVLSALLEGDGFLLENAATGSEGLRAARNRALDLILLDLGLPDIGGFDVLKELKNSPYTEGVPVIVLTARTTTADKLTGFELGAVDYLTKPFETSELRARIRAVVRTHELQQRLEKANRELVAARVAAETMARNKAEFLAYMSHEIRTPMNGIISMASLLLETPMTHEQQGYLQTIATSSESLLSIVNDILDFSKIESGRLELESEPFSLRAVVEDALDVVASRAAEKQLELLYEFEDDMPPQFLGDPTRLRQVLVNLLVNGVKFTREGQVVCTVSVLPLPGDEGSPMHLHFALQDTGIGIAADRLAKLFKSFSQADPTIARQYGGTGLGLVISKRLVEMMGGKMWVESIPHKGSTFHFSLPLKISRNAEGGRPEIEVISTRQAPLCGFKLLLVEPNPSLERMIARVCANWGVCPKATASPAQALEWIRAGERFDAALIDLQQPETSGLKLASELRRCGGSTLPLLLLSPLGTRSDAAEVQAAQFFGFLSKPLKPSQLLSALLSVVSGPKKEPVVAAVKTDRKLAMRLPLRILLCDDNPLNQKVASRILQQMGYEPVCAANGLEAIELLKRAPYDLVFMDLMMPEMDGIAATEGIRKLQATKSLEFPGFSGNITIIAMTASAMQGDRERCLAAGMNDYIAKPVRPDDIRRLIEKWGAQQPSEPSAPPRNPADNDLPVDLDRINEFTEGDLASLKELLTLYLNQTSSQLEDLNAAVKSAAAENVRRIAHSCAGASATCGMRRMVSILRTLEKQGAEGVLTGAEALVAQAQAEFQRVQEFAKVVMAQPESGS